MKNWKFLILLFVVGYAFIYWRLTKPISAEAPAEKELSLTSKQKVIQDMAEYVEKEHEGAHKKTEAPPGASPKAHYFVTERPIEIGSFEINDQLKEQLSTPEGASAFEKQIGDRAQAMSAEVESAFKKDHFRSADEQTTLLDLAHALAHATKEPMMTERLATEARRYLIPSEQMDSVYGGRALQYYLDTETDQDKRAAMVRSLHPDPESEKTQ